MSLTVDVFISNVDGEMEVLDVPEGCDDAIGPEVWRTLVWGSAAVRALGARYFPVLDGADLVVRSDDLLDFRDECCLIEANLDSVTPEGNADKTRDEYREDIRKRLEHIQTAIDRALAVGGGVVLW